MKKIVPIKYTSRDYNSIKQDLIEYAKRYYPNTYKDFNEASFGSLMIDSLAYIGDNLSFYLDYQANENYLETATEFDNIIKIGKQLGYKFSNSASSSGLISFYVLIPANTDGTPNLNYAPVIKKGTILSTKDGGRFILNEDVLMDDSNNEIRVATVNDITGKPTQYAIKSKGIAISGYIDSETISVGEFERFKKIELSQLDIIEVISVIDAEGNEYFEVDNLGQNIIYKAITNRNSDDYELANYILKPYIVPRRYVVDRELRKTFLQFGASEDIKISDTNTMVTEPVRVVLNQFGKNYISDTSFDPTKLINSDKFGIAPANTQLLITYRYNGTKNVNYAIGSINKVLDLKLEFRDETILTANLMNNVRTSIEVNNEEAIIGDSTIINKEELKKRIENSFSSQKRAVTDKDYETLIYSMPSKFGFIKRCKIVKDQDSFKRNLNLYILSEDVDGKLILANQTIKNNIKTWILQHKMINDSIDILDGKIINYGINFTVLGVQNKSKYDILNAAINQLKIDFARVSEFGETFYISDIYASLKKVPDVLDVVNIEIIEKVGGVYSDSRMNIKSQISADGRYINVPKNVCMELKYPSNDIKGTIL